MKPQKPPLPAHLTEQHCQLLIDSYQKWTGRHLIHPNPQEDLKQQLFYHDHVIVSHGTEQDPLLNFGNQKALELWEMDFDTFTSTPSRLTAEPQNQAERAQLLKDVKAQGYSDGYSGIRISSTGKRFYIQQATVWNLANKNDQYCGQAATFSRWEDLH